MNSANLFIRRMKNITMVVPKKNIRACMKCGCIYSENSLENVMRCPVCKSMLGEHIEGFHDE